LIFATQPWPPQAQGASVVLDSKIPPDEWLQSGQVKLIEAPEGGPIRLTARDNPDQPSTIYQFDFKQASSLYTLKFFAFTESSNRETVDLSSMTQAQTVQDVIDRELETFRALPKPIWISTHSAPPALLWTTQNLTIRVSRT
jgi:hypothetical protein